MWVIYDKVKQLYVYEYSPEHIHIVFTDLLGMAKRFRKNTAKAFLKKYGNAGYGLNPENCIIEFAYDENI